MINDTELKKLIELGKFTKNIMDDVVKIPKAGQNILEIVEFIENRIFEAGYLPAFPTTVCINEQAAHFTVFDEEVFLKDGDLIKIDFGVSDDGYATDNATTLEIGSGKIHEKLMNANKEVLRLILETTKVGTTLSEMGSIAHKTAKKYGFDTIHNLCGHEIKRGDLHAGLSIPNYDTGSKSEIKDGMQVAIEPFMTAGEPMIVERNNSNILKLEATRPVRDAIAKKVLKHIIDNYSELPFSKRWLLKEFDKRKVLYALRFLKANGNIHEYGILYSSSNHVVSQFEHCIIFYKGKKYIITDEVMQ